MRAARDAVTGVARPPIVIAVTVLTSLADADLARMGLREGAAATVASLAALAKQCGLDGVVCSAQEASALRRAHGPGFVLVTPGIRLAGAAADDQARVVTPPQAVRLGADYLVIGRPITGASDPVAALHAIRQSLEEEIA